MCVHLPPDPTIASILLQIRLCDPLFDKTLYDSIVIAEQVLDLGDVHYAILDNARIRDYVVTSKYKIQLQLTPAERECHATSEGSVSGLV